MSFNKVTILALVLLLIWYWLGREADTLVIEQTQITESTEPGKASGNELQFIEFKASSPQQIKTQECAFPIFHDFDGASYNLRFNSSVDSGNLISEISSAAGRLISTYANWLDTSFAGGISLNFSILPEQEFIQFLTGKVADPKAYIGVYLPAQNSAVIKYVNHQQAISTSVHELVHVVNFALFGHLPRFINEGLAEYFEGQTGLSTKSEFHLPQGIDKEQARAELLDFYALMNSEHDWHTSNNQSLYLSGSAWAHFLMTSELGLEAMKKMLAQKYEQPCVAITSDEITTILNDTYPNFEQEFYYWFDENTQAN